MSEGPSIAERYASAADYVAKPTSTAEIQAERPDWQLRPEIALGWTVAIREW